jgi:hypothetical protein
MHRWFYHLTNPIQENCPGGHGLRDSQNQAIIGSTWGELAVNVETYDWAGDVDQSRTIDLKDVILVLKILSRQSPESVYVEADINQDGTLGLEEAIKGLETSMD